MKKMFVLILCIVLAFVPAACTSNNNGSSADTTAADKTAENTGSSADSTAADKAAVSNNSSEDTTAADKAAVSNNSSADTTAEDNTAGNNSPDADKAAPEQELKPSEASQAADPKLVPGIREDGSSQKSVKRPAVQPRNTEAPEKAGERRKVAVPSASPVK